jgi:hypothetical protein
MILASAGAAAAKPAKDCSEPFTVYEINADWDGGALPAPGEDPWWDLTLAGLAAEGLTAEDAGELFVGGTANDFYQLVIDGLQSLDRNDDDRICGKTYPEHQNGTPLYFINAVDNNARLH